MTIGTVPYLNARPLVDWFYDTEEGRASEIEVIEAPPSELARLLERGEIACGLLSSVELFRRPDFGYIPGIAIAADGPVESVRLFCREPRTRVRRVALDTSSLTSVALVRLLATRLFGAEPVYIAAAPELQRMLLDADAALLIGDRGFEPVEGVAEIIDLGQAWKDATQLPFVYALWIGPKRMLTEPLRSALASAMEWGLARLPELAEREAARHGTTPARARHYLEEIMVYRMGAREEAALAVFGEGIVGGFLRESVASNRR